MQKIASLSILSCLVLSACTTNPKTKVQNLSSQEIFQLATSELQKGDFKNALNYLNTLDGKVFEPTFSEQIQLDLIYANYKAGDYANTNVLAQRFMRNYSLSSSLDYVYLINGLSYVRSAEHLLQDFFKVNQNSHDATPLQNAYKSFESLVNQYPKSKYISQAKQWLMYIQQSLAKQELEIIKFYMARNAYVAVANRAQDMIIDFPDSLEKLQAMQYLKIAFDKLGIEDSKMKVEQLIKNLQSKNFTEVAKPSLDAVK